MPDRDVPGTSARACANPTENSVFDLHTRYFPGLSGRIGPQAPSGLHKPDKV